MSDIAIRCEGLSKRYRIGERESYKALRDVITDGVASPFRRLRSALAPNGAASNGSALASENGNSFWALEDVSFEVRRGEVVGIIGRNGAGKSTLLKILSRITKPTRGHAQIHGRVGSLLEVGTGFHPELTGRENIYLNAAILGMRNAEVAKKFDEMVAFAEVDKFIDTPVKRYSSGMYVRLAFAVAAHMETEVLLVDEVLAVGDAQFQKKCLGKMGEVANEGRTVLFVSHSMGAITSLTKRAVLLSQGGVVFDGPTQLATQRYLSESLSNRSGYTAVEEQKMHQVMEVSLPSLGSKGFHLSGDTLKVKVRIRSRATTQNGCLSIQVVNQSLHPVLHLRAYDNGVYFGDRVGDTTLICEIPRCSLNVGRYSLTLFTSGPPGHESYEQLSAICPFDVEIHDQMALFGWRSEVCSYIVPELWIRR